MSTDEVVSRTLMLLCFGGAGVLFSAPQQAPPTTSPGETLALSSTKTTVSEAAQDPTSSTKVNTQLIVKLSDRRVYLYRAGQIKASYPIAVGQIGWETPIGNFKVLQMHRNPVWRQPITGEIVAAGRDNPLGDRWIGFWVEGSHQIGFHGTNTEKLVGKAVSHGCLRMRNQDIRAMYEQVSKGTLVIVRK